MFKTKLLYWLFAVKTSLCNCSTEVNQEGFRDARSLYHVVEAGHLPAVVNESSGLSKVEGKETFWTHNDGGGKPEIYEVDLKGNLVSSCELRGIQNVDWEDLSRDSTGNLLIGDFGNNGNDRRDLRMYRINLQDPARSGLIQFRYGNQTEFPPARRRDRIFDCEAFFAHGDSLYLFSKNRGSDLRVRMYALPNQPGNYVLEPKTSTRIEQQVTAADVAPDGKTFALLTYGKVLFYAIENGRITFDHPLYCLKLARRQTEGLAFVNNTDLLISNEQGELFLVVKDREGRSE
jgi:hypothetical protein